MMMLLTFMYDHGKDSFLVKTKVLSLVSIKPRQRPSLSQNKEISGKMAAPAHDRLVFCVVVVDFANCIVSMTSYSNIITNKPKILSSSVLVLISIQLR